MSKDIDGKQKSSKMDTITATKKTGGDLTIEAPQKKQALPKRGDSVEIEVTNDKVPPRGILWYVFFVLSFVALSALAVYLSEWVALFFVVVMSIAILWRGHNSNRMKFEVNKTGVVVNGREFQFEQIDRYYFSEIGEDITVNIVLAKKRFPILAYILLNGDDFENVREKLANQIPETEPRGENFPDLIIRIALTS